VLASHSEFFKNALSQRWQKEGQVKVRLNLCERGYFLCSLGPNPIFSAISVRPESAFLQLEIPCNGSEDLEAAQKVLKIMYTLKLDPETIRAQQSGGRRPSLVQLLTKVRSFMR